LNLENLLKSVFVRQEMPRVRRLGHIPQLSDFKRGRTVGLREAGLSEKLSEDWQICMHHFKMLSGTGRRRMTTENQDAP
jgi:hypothetical protein